MNLAKNFNVGDRFEVTSYLGMDSGYIGNKGTVVRKYDNGYGVVMDGDEGNRWSSDDEYMKHIDAIEIIPKKKKEKSKNELYYLTVDGHYEKNTVRDSSGKLLDSFNDFEPEENFTVIRNSTTTIIITDDGCKGVSKLCEGDVYDAQLGFEIAYCKAMVKRWQKMLKVRTK